MKTQREKFIAEQGKELIGQLDDAIRKTGGHDKSLVVIRDGLESVKNAYNFSPTTRNEFIMIGKMDLARAVLKMLGFISVLVLLGFLLL